jgi:anaerobic selenocysteine-containing dehydrogenase
MEAHKTDWKWEEDGYTVTRSCAWSGPGCHNGCGVLLYTKDGKLVKVEGDPDNPYNNGRLCVRCLALADVTNHPDRLQYPMKRAGKRGENKWKRITWDEAYDTIEREFNKVKEKYGPESVLFAQGTGRDILPYISRLAFSFGSPTWTSLITGFACYIPRVAQLICTTGGFLTADCSQYFKDRYDNPAWKVPETIVLWGNNPVVSNPDYFYGQWIVDCMKRGSKLIVIDPRMTWSASRAALWLPIRPGTDAALALGMLNIIIKEELYDKEFVDKWCYGFDKLVERAAQYPVEKVAEITWIPKEKIIAAARLYAKSKPAAIQWGVAVDMTKESLPAGQAISDLWNITGNVDIPGGNMFTFPPNGVDASVNPGWGYEELLSAEAKAKRIGANKYPLYNFGFLFAQPDEVVETLVTEKPYPIKAAWLQTTNPIACMGADPLKLDKGLSKLDFIAAVDIFMTPTIVKYADIVLPAATFPERDGIRATWYYVGAINKVTQVGECKSDMQINLELGKRFNPKAWPWENVQEMYDFMVKNADVTFEGLREQSPMYPIPEYVYKKYEKGLLRQDGKPGFNTPTGRIELTSTIFEKLGLDPLPYFEEPDESPNSTPDLYKEYPLVLTTGARQWGTFHSEHRQIPRLRSIHPNPTIQINADTAAKYGLEDGDWAWVENSRGRAKRKVEITPTIDPRIVSADHGWWFPEKEAADPSLFGLWDVNINKLIPWSAGRSGFGGNYKSLLCKIYKVKEEA